MGYRNDVYSSPENFDLEIIHMLDDDWLSYEFDMLGVWLHKPTGALYWAEDTGCSCPSPFEDYMSLESLGEPLSAANFHELEEAVTKFSTGYDGSRESTVAATDKAALLHDVKRRLEIFV